MLSNMPKPILKTILSLFVLSFTIVACNSGGDKKEEKKDTVVVTPPPAPTTPAPEDTAADLMKTDTMPVKQLP
jgi:hypothetical protein